jgi:FkbM family methyltransferase
MTIRLSDFRTFAMANMMKLEEILAEVYVAHTTGKSDFAIFDGGAHKGYHTTRMANLHGVAKVYAVEADPFMVDTLRSNLGERLTKASPEIQLVEAALQKDPAVSLIQWKSSPSHVGRSSIVSDNVERSTIWGDNPDMKYRESMCVKATTIDTILALENRILPFLKLDLEGADLLALQGAEQTLRDKRPIVAFENSIHAPKVHGFTLEDIAAYFERLNYVPINFVGDSMDPGNWFGFFEAWAAPREHADWLTRTVKDRITAQMSAA